MNISQSKKNKLRDVKIIITTILVCVSVAVAVFYHYQVKNQAYQKGYQDGVNTLQEPLKQLIQK